jgi:hypothetical protein
MNRATKVDKLAPSGGGTLWCYDQVCETVIHSLFPMHIGMRQYWRDVDSLLKWTRSDPRRQW